MLPSEYNQDFAAQRRLMMDTRRLRERATGDSLLVVVQESKGWAIVRLEHDKPGAIRERLQGNFANAHIALRSAKRIQNSTREHIKMERQDQHLKDMFTESLMRAEFPTQQDAGAFMLSVAQDKKLARFPGKRLLPRKVGTRFEVEFLASKTKAGTISDIARKNNGKLSFVG
ncbi:MAG: hypothetical protein QQN46_02085 [Nitrosopumilus sp.]